VFDDIWRLLLPFTMARSQEKVGREKTTTNFPIFCNPPQQPQMWELYQFFSIKW